MTRRPEVEPATPSPAQVRMERAVMDAIKGLANWSFTRVIGQPEAGDADCLKHDLIAISEIVDDLVKAFGAYTNSTIGIAQEDLDVFQTPLRDAIDGNAIFVLDKAAEYLRDLNHDTRTSRRMLEAAE